MVNCEECNRQFKTRQALNGHKRMHGPSEGALVGRRKESYGNTRKFSSACDHCSIDFKHHASSYGKYCSLKCQGAAKRSKSFSRVEAGTGTAGALKLYLIARDGESCSICKITEWMGNPVTFQLDHIDGNSDNNKLENGRILCPNCHSQTSTYSGRNTKNTKRNRYLQQYKSEKKQIRSCGRR